MKMKLCLVITTRGNYAKVKSILQAAENDPDVELQIIVGGGAILAKYGNIADSLTTMGVNVDRRIHFLVEGETPVTMAKSAGLAVSEFTTAFENLQPDVVMVIADRFECLSIAMTASYMNIPVAHMEGGEVSGSIDESIRHAITKLSHVHFPATREAADRIIRMGEAPETVFPVGATSLDVIAGLDLDNLQPIMEKQVSAGVGARVDLAQPYLTVIQHPVTTEYAENLEHVNQTLNAIHELGMGTIWIWPNMDAGSDGISKGIRIFREKHVDAPMHFFKSLPIEHYAPLLKNAKAIVGNSSSGIREAAFLGTPCVNIGSRQSGRDRSSNIIDVGYDKAEIKAAIQKQLDHGRYEENHMWGDGKAGPKILEILKTFDFTIQKRICY